MANIYTLSWDGEGTKLYENGVSRGVLYTKTGTNGAWKGVAWNGLTAVTESPEGADKTDLWADNIKYASMRAAETFGGTIEAYTYPPEFEACNGEATLGDVAGLIIGQQVRQPFCMCYRTEIGNDTDGAAHGYKLHLIYNCTCSPSERAYETINDSPDAITFSWEFDTTPVDTGDSSLKQTACITVDSTKIDSGKLAKLEAKLYGNGTTEATIPFPNEIVAVLNAA